MVAPVYISEIAPPKYRGRLVISFQMSVVAGILVAYGSNYLLQGVGGVLNAAKKLAQNYHPRVLESHQS